MRRRRSWRTKMMLHGACFLTPEGDPAGGGSTAPPTDGDPPAPKPTKPAKTLAPPPEPVKISMTPEELETERAKARDAYKAEVAEQQRAEKEEGDRKAAEEKGEWEKLAKDEKVKREERDRENEQLKIDNKRHAIRDQIRAYLAEKHKDYVENAIDILPHVTFDLATTDSDIAKRIATAADAFVKRTPRAVKASSAPPPNTPHSGGNSYVPPTRNGSSGQPVKFTGASARF